MEFTKECQKIMGVKKGDHLTKNDRVKIQLNLNPQTSSFLTAIQPSCDGVLIKSNYYIKVKY